MLAAPQEPPFWVPATSADASVSTNVQTKAIIVTEDKHKSDMLMSRCRLTGECLAGRGNAVGRPWRLALHAADAHSNARGRGGEAVSVEVCGPEGSGVRAAAVQDERNGCYTIALTPDRAGRWVLHPRCASVVLPLPSEWTPSCAPSHGGIAAEGWLGPW